MYAITLIDKIKINYLVGRRMNNVANRQLSSVEGV